MGSRAAHPSREMSRDSPPGLAVLLPLVPSGPPSGGKGAVQGPPLGIVSGLKLSIWAPGRESKSLPTSLSRSGVGSEKYT